MEKIQKNLTLFSKVLFLVSFFGVCLWAIIAEFTLPSEKDPRDYYTTTFNEGWYQVFSDGTHTPIQVPGTCDVVRGETAVIEKQLPSEIDTGMWICFRTTKNDIKIYVDDVLRNSYDTKNSRPFGTASVSTYLFVQLKESDASKTIRVEMTSDSAYSGVVRSILYGDKTAFIYQIFLDNAVALIFAIIMIALGIGSVIISYILQYKLKVNIHLRHLGWCVIAVSFWIVTQSKLRQFFFPNTSIISAFSEFILLLIPIPFALYMNKIQENRYQKYYIILQILASLNFLVCVPIIAFSIIEQTDLNVNIYIILGLHIILILTTMALDAKKNYIQKYRLVAYGILGLILTAIMQMVLNLNKTNLLNGDTLCIGLVFLLFMAIVQTTIDLIKIENQRQQAIYEGDAKAKFLASMSHEIRTPINAVLGINEIIARESNEPHIREYAEDVQTAGRSLLAIINDILDFSKIESGKMNIVLMDYDLASVINDSCNMIRNKAAEKGLEFKTFCNESLPSRLYGDEVRLRQILINLLSNGVKYTNEGSVTLRVDGTADDKDNLALKFVVEDTGIGIKPENISLLFNSFSRVEDNTTHKIEGTGLGLSIVHNLVTLMKGEVKVESTYGEGSVFTVTIPQPIISTVPIGNLTNAYNSNEITDTSDEEFLAPGARILVVDDVPMNLKVFCGLLKNTLMNIDTANSGRECLLKLKSNTYDIIFLDHMMPELDGVETLKEMHATGNEKLKKTPVIMITANAILGAKEEYLGYGFTDYISKPVQKSKLLDLVKKYLPEELILSREEEHTTEEITDIKEITFLNTKLGLSFYSGDKEFYLDIIKSFLEEDRSAQIQEFYDKEDWDNYRILVHAVKSTAKSIGAEDLAEVALKQETAAKTNDLEYIHAHHEEFQKTYRELLLNIGKLFIGNKNPATMPLENNTFNILIVDDDAIIRKSATRILEDYFNITCLERGREALEYLKTHLPDLILLDIHMPEMDGFEVIREIKNNPVAKDIPVIFLTADIDSETELNSFKAGAMDYIKKPFIPDIMLERINRIIELDRLQQYLQKEVQQKTTQVEKLSLQAMMSLAQTIDAKDTYTKGHSNRVAQYSKKLAKKIGLSAADQDTVYFMGLLHDIGKIGIPDYIINKPSKLTDDEFAIVKKHPIIGYDILKDFAGIPNIEIGARWHHERLDGKGYPDGLIGEAIPKLVRIISVADSYDAMTSKRSYRDVLPQDYIKAELARGKGTQFDPAVVDAMIELINEDTKFSMRGN